MPRKTKKKSLDKSNDTKHPNSNKLTNGTDDIADDGTLFKLTLLI